MRNPESERPVHLNPVRSNVDAVLKTSLTLEQLVVEQSEWTRILQPFNCKRIDFPQEPCVIKAGETGIATSFLSERIPVITIADAYRKTGEDSGMSIAIYKTPNGYFVKTICHEGADGSGSKPFEEMTKEQAIAALKKEIKEWDGRPCRLDEMPI
jgi:hypothetical protein